jgi:putative addiction module component (TIGR02574 family)
MSGQAEQVLSEALHLSAMERAELVERLLESFDFPKRREIDAAWAEEVEGRIDAYEEGKIGATPAAKVFEKFEKRQ